MQLLFVTDGIFPHAVGGMQRHSRLLIEELSKIKELELIVIHPHDTLKVFKDSDNIKEIGLKTTKTKNISEYFFNAYKYSKQVYKELKKFPGALIYSQGMSVWYGIKDVGNRLIINPHGLEPYQVLTLKEKIITAPYRYVHNYLFKHAAKIVSLGGRLTDIFIKDLNLPKEKIAVLPNAANVPELISRNFNHTPLQFLFVGRFAFNKGIQTLVDTVLELNKEGYADKFRFALVGKGPLYDHFLNTYKEPNLKFYGGADDAALFKLYKESDVFVLPTLFEGMPTVVLEAMGYGLPVIVTDTGATRQLVDESNGFIIEKKDVSSLKSAILKYAGLNAEERKKLSEASYNKLKNNFTWTIVAQQHFELFKSCSK
ncbi:MAG TPA: glycosyltransferase family 4 protein [Bacteroidia bacterium]|nr:glycosyltransferase family 4 protein [Bacteroidia bacterium]